MFLANISLCRHPQDLVSPFFKFLPLTTFSFPQSQIHLHIERLSLLGIFSMTFNLPNFCPSKSKLFRNNTTFHAYIVTHKRIIFMIFIYSIYKLFLAKSGVKVLHLHAKKLLHTHIQASPYYTHIFLH